LIILFFGLKVVSFGAFLVEFYVIYSYKRENKETQYKSGKSNGQSDPAPL